MASALVPGSACTSRHWRLLWRYQCSIINWPVLLWPAPAGRHRVNSALNKMAHHRGAHARSSRALVLRPSVVVRAGRVFGGGAHRGHQAKCRRRQSSRMASIIGNIGDLQGGEIATGDSAHELVGRSARNGLAASTSWARGGTQRRSRR